MKNKNNLNYSMEQNNYVLGTKISKFSLLALFGVLISSFLLIFLPILLALNFIVAIITFGVINLLNMIFAIKFSFMESSIYETFHLLIKYKTNVQKLSSKKLVNDNVVWENDNVIAFVFEKQLIIKSLHKVSLKIREENSDNDLMKAKESLLRFLSKQSEFRSFSLNLSFDVEENINFINSLIRDNINFNDEKNKESDESMFLMQQMSFFNSLNDSNENNQLNVFELSMTFPLLTKSIDTSSKEWLSFLSVFMEEYNDLYTFSSDSLKLQNLTVNEFKIAKKKIYFLEEDKSDISFTYKNSIIETNEGNKKYARYLKLEKIPYQLDAGWIRFLFNNPFRYNTSLVFHPLEEKDETKIINQIERENLQNEEKKRESRSKKLRKVINSEILEDMVIEMETQDNRSKAMSFIVEIEGDTHHDLIQKIKSFKKYYKKDRYLFQDCSFIQKEAFFDFHVGLENKLTKSGKEKKFRIQTKKFNNVNSNSLWLTSEACAYSLPFSDELIIEDNSLYFGHDMNNMPVAINLEADRPNHHISIFGKSGSGKTTATEMILKSRMIIKDGKQPLIIILDPKPEYLDIVEKYNGQSIDLSEGFVNPFLFNNEDPNSIKEIKEFLEFFLKGLLKDLEFVTSMMIVRILNIIEKSSEFRQNKMNFDVLHKLITNDKGFKASMNKNEYEDLCDFISLYGSKGRKSALFNSDLKLDFNRKIISFNFSKLIHGTLTSDSITLIFSVLYYLSSIMKQNDPKYSSLHKYNISILVDEFHLLVNSSDSSILKYFDKLYAISRSYGVGIITIFQNLEILNNKENSNAARSIFSNTSYFFVFQLDKKNLDHLTSLLPEHLYLTERESGEILSAVKHRSLAIFENTKKIVNWELGIFYDKDRDKNTDGRMESHQREKEAILTQIKDAYQIINGNVEVKEEDYA